MRISDARADVREAVRALHALRLEPTDPNAPDPLVRIFGTADARRALESLRASPLGPEVQRQVVALLDAPMMRSAEEPVSVPTSRWHAFTGLRDSLTTLLRAVNAVLQAIAPPEPEGAILVKLPSVDGLEDTAKVLTQLSRAFDHPLARLKEPPVQVLGVDSGSAWLVLAAQTGGALAIVTGMVSAFAKLLDAVARYRALSEHLRALKLDPAARAAQDAANLKTQEVLIAALADELAANPTGAAPRQPDSELVNTYVQSIKIMQELSQKGAEIRILAAKGIGVPAADVKAIGTPAEPPQLPSTGGSSG